MIFLKEKEMTINTLRLLMVSGMFCFATSGLLAMEEAPQPEVNPVEVAATESESDHDEANASEPGTPIAGYDAPATKEAEVVPDAPKSSWSLRAGIAKAFGSCRRCARSRAAKVTAGVVVTGVALVLIHEALKATHPELATDYCNDAYTAQAREHLRALGEAAAAHTAYAHEYLGDRFGAGVAHVTNAVAQATNAVTCNRLLCYSLSTPENIGAVIKATIEATATAAPSPTELVDMVVDAVGVVASATVKATPPPSSWW